MMQMVRTGHDHVDIAAGALKPSASLRTGRAARACRALRACAGLAAAVTPLLLGSGLAMAQEAAPAKPPMDVNRVGNTAPPPPIDLPSGRPSVPQAEATGEPTKAASEQALESARAQGLVPATAIAEDGTAFKVSRFVLEYRSEHPDHPSLEALMDARVKVGVTPEGYVGVREGVPTVELRLGDLSESGGATFFASGLAAVNRGIFQHMSKLGFMGVFVQPHPEDIEEPTGKDLRSGRQELRLVIWTGRVELVRTLVSGERLAKQVDADPTTRVNNSDSVHTRIREQSPLQPGGLLRRDDLDNFVFGLNRHPGRRVDVAVAPGENPEQVVLDYMVGESKPWSIYAQISNTGTESTGEWRQRFGFVHNQLSGHDDILRIDYVTSSFEDSNAVAIGYEFPLLSDSIRTRLYGSYSEFTASELGLDRNEQFSGETFTAGAEVVGTVYQKRESFIDLVGGLRFQNVSITNDVSLSNPEGKENFLIPYVGVRFDRVTESVATLASLTMEFQIPELAGTDAEGIQDLGRQEVDDNWQVVKFDASHSFYLEPLLNPRGFRGEAGTSGPMTLAHEVFLSLRGQYAFDYRLIANEQDVAGGMFSVRGYPESATAGDNVVVATAEYRFHVPRVLPISEPGYIGGRKGPGLFGGDFKWAPQQSFGRTDWDLILKAFVDAARTVNNNAVEGENNQTLVGTGIGAELQYKRNMFLRLDLGVALTDVEDDANPVESGNTELHFSLTVLY